jgi:guanylate kinase
MAEDLPGILVVLSGPSGVGKTTVANRLKEKGGYRQSLSVTTRPARANETEGVHYRYISKEEFERLRDSSELLEHAEFAGDCYGTPKQPLREALKAREAFLLVIDVQGGWQIRGKGLDSLLIFLAPPNKAELIERLKRRGTEDANQQTIRLQRADIEMEKATEFYNHIIVNKDLDTCVEEVHALVLDARRKLKEKEQAGETLYPGLKL